MFLSPCSICLKTVVSAGGVRPLLKMIELYVFMYCWTEENRKLGLFWISLRRRSSLSPDLGLAKGSLPCMKEAKVRCTELFVALVVLAKFEFNSVWARSRSLLCVSEGSLFWMLALVVGQKDIG